MTGEVARCGTIAALMAWRLLANRPTGVAVLAYVDTIIQPMPGTKRQVSITWHGIITQAQTPQTMLEYPRPRAPKHPASAPGVLAYRQSWRSILTRICWRSHMT